MRWIISSDERTICTCRHLANMINCAFLHTYTVTALNEAHQCISSSSSEILWFTFDCYSNAFSSSLSVLFVHFRIFYEFARFVVFENSKRWDMEKRWIDWKHYISYVSCCSNDNHVWWIVWNEVTRRENLVNFVKWTLISFFDEWTFSFIFDSIYGVPPNRIIHNYLIDQTWSFARF